MELSESGKLTVVDKKSGTQRALQVPTEELAKIYALLLEAKELQPSSKPPACRDCLQYDIDLFLDGRRFTFQVNDLNVSDAGLAPLVKALNELQARAIAGQF